MGKQLDKIFGKVESKAQELSEHWNNFATEISGYLPETYQPEIQELSRKLEDALNHLIDQLRNPTLVLATTGTTSSGKSTLVNLLCGAEIVPVAVSEMSAGAVTIEYNPEKSLIIHETPGALWECGEWKGITEDRIYQRLNQVMITYIDNREKQPNLACPQSTIFYPFRLLKESQLQLPPGTKVKILDLPGLSYVGDQENANVIKQCREALCLVTYNSQETDVQKQKSLLQEVVQQVKDLGGSPARMLFILNRIDVFRADKDWPETENRFIKKTIYSIKNELTDHLTEYTEDIENLQVVKLSTWPALLALQIPNNDDVFSAEACRTARNYFSVLIEDVLDDLQGNVQKWSSHDRMRVSKALWQQSYAEEFQQNLKEHITQHFPQLVIPQAIEQFNVAAGNAVAEWAVQTTTAILNSSEKEYQQECENILHIRLAIEQFLEENDKNLRKPFEEIDTEIKKIFAGKSKNDALYQLQITISKINEKKPYNELGNKLRPLFAWRQELKKGINQVLEAVGTSLDSGRVNLDNPNLKRASFSHIKPLENNLKRLIGLGYTASIAKNGETIQAKTDDDKKKLSQLNQELNELSIHLNHVMEDVLNKISTQEIERIYEAVVELLNCHLSHLEKGVNDIAPNIIIRFPESQLNQVKRELLFRLNFESGFSIKEETWKEETRNFWHWLWLIPKSETRSSDNATIPSTEQLLKNWNDQLQLAEPEIIKEMISWLLEQIDYLNKDVKKIQNDIFDRYQTRLDKAHQEITLDYEKQKNLWQPMEQKAKQLAQEFAIFNIEKGGLN
ncbi:dynamin family protein [Planktothrix agardhii]|uniref:dynamin family protein n=1 Tax=Planktothrix agardhii TaxID=1160 RepID=UPI0003FC425E|nr:dynamin family protein [Planktothrix agardhii]